MSAENKLREFGIKEKDISLYVDILSKSTTYEKLAGKVKHQCELRPLHASAQQLLGPVLIPLYKNNADYREELIKNTDDFGFSREQRENYFLDYKGQPLNFNLDNEDIPLENRLKFIEKADSLVLKIVKEHLGL